MSGTEIAVYDSWLNQVLTKLSDPVVGRGLDPLGGYLGFTDPFVQNPNTTYDSLHPNEGLYLQDANPFDPGSGCELDGMPTDCSRLTRALENGTVGVQIGAGGKIYNVSNYQAGFGGVWIGQWTPGQPADDPDDPIYREKWVPFGSGQQDPQLPRGHMNLPYIFQLLAIGNANVEAERRLQSARCASLFNRAIMHYMDPIDVAEIEISGLTPDFGLQYLQGTHYRLYSQPPEILRRGALTSVKMEGAATIAYNDVWINLQGPFFNNRINVPGAGLITADFGTGLGQTAFAALLRLHELGHQVGIFGKDATDPVKNRGYTQAVIDNCFPDARNHR